MKIAVFSPLNPIKTGISDYTEELLPELANHFDIDIFIDPAYEPISEEITTQFKIIPFDITSFDPKAYDQILYHMGNYYEGHRYIYESLKQFPGIVVLHDYVLQGFYAERYHANGDFERYQELLVKLYGQEGEEIAKSIIEKHPSPIWESEKALDYPLNEEVIQNAQALIVHSEFVKQQIQKQWKKTIEKIPSHEYVIQEYDEESIRKDLGVNDDEVLICSAGFINKNKRFDRILAAILALDKRNFKYVIVGNDQGRLLENYIPADCDNVITKGHLPIQELEGLIAASDICINLRYPTMGESSASLLRMMGHGKPTLVSNCGAYAEFPDYCVLKVDVDIDEIELIRRYVQALIEDEDFRRSLGQEARSYIKNECGIKKCAEDYAMFIKKIRHD